MPDPAPDPAAAPEPVPDTGTDSSPGRAPESAPDPVAAPPADDVSVYRMPFPVRAAQVLALGLAAVGVGCTVTAGWLSGSHVALITGLSFVASWVLGAVALAFGAVGASIRIAAVLLAVLNALWTVPSIVVGRPPGWLGPVVSVLVAGLLLRRSARDWFEP
ncbi:hypothetical protein [Nocardia africana]|uniref:Uncharacterized protein n=1 Tax=Nocardia africana TaxID=134964 RepID=A0A378X4L1_9NOCA|nr:hypothetical protein [Nocardia africana]MCC3317600.1 hypothetical protein [Nocardia africana]SUA48359.1 Uncharacterised protein [Nocardia africana]